MAFHFSFFLWTKLGLFLMLPLAFVFFSLVTHICFSLLENDLLPRQEFEAPAQASAHRISTS